MILRFILVGLVVGLGFSLPTERDLETLARSAQDWMNARLAEWDAKTAYDPGAPVFVVEPPPSLPVVAAPSAPLEPAPALVVVAAPPVMLSPPPSYLVSLPPATPAPAVVEEVAVVSPPISDQGFTALLDETAALFTQDERSSKAIAAEAVMADQSELTLPAPADLFAIEAPTVAAAMAAEVPVAAALSVMPSIQPLDQVAPSPSLVPMPAPEMLADHAEADQRTDLAFAEALEATVAGFAEDAEALARAEPEGEKRRIEPAEVAGDLEAGGADRPVAPSGSTANQDRLTNAVRLTREAAIAWASLLHGPAVVTISR